MYRRSEEDVVSETASERRRLGRRPSLVAKREEGARDQLDQRIGGNEMEGGLEGEDGIELVTEGGVIS